MILNEIVKERFKDYFCFEDIFKLIDLSLELIKYLKAKRIRSQSVYKALNEVVNLLMAINAKMRPLARTFSKNWQAKWEQELLLWKKNIENKQ